MSNKRKFKDYKKCNFPVYETPRSVQETIPVYKISEDGIFQLENTKGMNTFDKAYSFSDINYALKDDDEKKIALEKWCEVLDSLNTHYKIVVVNRQRDETVLKNEINMQSMHEGKIYQSTTKSLNQYIQKNVEKGNNNIEREKYFILSCKKFTLEEAKIYFNVIEGTVTERYNNLKSKLVPISAVDRLRTLHGIYRPGQENLFDVTWEDLKTQKRDWKNDICNLLIDETQKGELFKKGEFLRFGTQVGCVLFARAFKGSVEDSFFTELTTSLPFPSVTTLDVFPIPQDASMEKIQKSLDNVEGSISREQEIRNKSKSFSSDISRPRRKAKESLENELDELEDTDGRYFYTGLTVFVFAEDEVLLKQRVESIVELSKSNVEFEICYCQQLKAFQTTLPVCVSYIEHKRLLSTSSLAGFVPFNVQEMRDKDGICYGINQISKNLIKANRKKLKNGNGFIYAPSGSGKSVLVKDEVDQVLNFTNDDVVIMDPSNEYIEMCDLFGGQVVNFSSNTETYLNPLDIPKEVFENQKLQPEFITDKAEFMQGISRSIMGHELSGRERSVVDRTVLQMYEEIFSVSNDGGEQVIPTFHEYQEILKVQTPQQEAEDLSVSMEVFVTGSLNIFSHQSNVNIHNRFVCYCTRDLGKSLKKLAMLVMMEGIRARLAYNRDNHKATWLWGDELHVIFDDDESTLAWEKLWKVTRKDGGLATGITQNISDNLYSKQAKTMVSNSEYLVLLSQSKIDLMDLHNIIELSNTQIRKITEQPEGTGLIKFGSNVIAFDHRIPKDNLLYWLYNTNPHEAKETEYQLRKFREYLAKEDTENYHKGLLDHLDEPDEKEIEIEMEVEEVVEEPETEPETELPEEETEESELELELEEIEDAILESSDDEEEELELLIETENHEADQESDGDEKELEKVPDVKEERELSDVETLEQSSEIDPEVEADQFLDKYIEKEQDITKEEFLERLKNDEDVSEAHYLVALEGYKLFLNSLHELKDMSDK